ncbi:MAG: thermonuclease family protein [Xanthobacteraceae bacterium]
MKTARIAGLFGALVAFMHIALAQDGAAPACGAQTIGIFVAGAAIDGRSFRLKDGRDVRLAGIEVPPGDAARQALEKRLAGSLVLLKRMEPGSDRYGRILAHVFALRDGAEALIAQEMVSEGHARAGAHIGEPACATALLAAEGSARKAKLGLWADPSYAIKSANDAAALLAARGRFTVAEGPVLSVRESAGTIYINFGRVWSRNLTVSILKRNERLFAAAGIDPKKLEGRRLRVRGWVEERGGPRIEADWPEQIEIADRE